MNETVPIETGFAEVNGATIFNQVILEFLAQVPANVEEKKQRHGHLTTNSYRLGTGM